jgi:hypothetical protein
VMSGRGGQSYVRTLYRTTCFGHDAIHSSPLQQRKAVRKRNKHRATQAVPRVPNDVCDAHVMVVHDDGQMVCWEPVRLDQHLVLHCN